MDTKVDCLKSYCIVSALITFLLEFKKDIFIPSPSSSWTMLV